MLILRECFHEKLSDQLELTCSSVHFPNGREGLGPRPYVNVLLVHAWTCSAAENGLDVGNQAASVHAGLLFLTLCL